MQNPQRDIRRGLQELLWEANFLGEPRRAWCPSNYQQTRVYPYPLGAESARPNPKMGAPDPENPLFLRFSVLRGGLRPRSQTMVSEGARPWGRGRSGDCEISFSLKPYRAPRPTESDKPRFQTETNVKTPKCSTIFESKRYIPKANPFPKKSNLKFPPKNLKCFSDNLWRLFGFQNFVWGMCNFSWKLRLWNPKKLIGAISGVMITRKKSLKMKWGNVILEVRMV